MGEKFINLAKAKQVIIVIATWLVSVCSFTGCVLLNEFVKEDTYWAEILLTIVGMFFCVVAICLSILFLSFKKKKDEQ